MRDLPLRWIAPLLALALAACGEEELAGADATLDDGGVADAMADGMPGETPDSPIPGRACPPDNTTDFDNTGGPLLTSWCIACHSSRLPPDQRAGATPSVDFDTVEGIRMWLPRIYARAADDNTTMPPTDAMSAEERQRLGDWIACGAPGLDDAMLPEPGEMGDGDEMDDPPADDPDAGPGDPDAGMGDGPTACETDADCEMQCTGDLGCACVERRNRGPVCVRVCEGDGDCAPGATCTDGLCGR